MCYVYAGTPGCDGWRVSTVCRCSAAATHHGDQKRCTRIGGHCGQPGRPDVRLSSEY